MKKVAAILVFLILVVNLWAFTYPDDLYGLFQKYKDLQTQLHIVTSKVGPEDKYRSGGLQMAISQSYIGKILVAGTDYLVFKTKDDDVFIIPYTAIVEVTEE